MRFLQFCTVVTKVCGQDVLKEFMEEIERQKQQQKLTELEGRDAAGWVMGAFNWGKTAKSDGYWLRVYRKLKEYDQSVKKETT